MSKRAGTLLPILFSFCVGFCFAQDSAGLLARILAGKGVISAGELARVEAASPESRVQMLVGLLEEKGVLTRAELAKLMPSNEPSFALAIYHPPPTQALATSTQTTNV